MEKRVLIWLRERETGGIILSLTGSVGFCTSMTAFLYALLPSLKNLQPKNKIIPTKPPTPTTFALWYFYFQKSKRNWKVKDFMTFQKYIPPFIKIQWSSVNMELKSFTSAFKSGSNVLTLAHHLREIILKGIA